MRRIEIKKEMVDDIIKSYNLGKNLIQVGKIFNLKNHIIKRILKENGIKIRTKKYDVDENFFEKIDTEEKSYWLGFLYADGYIRKRNNKYGNLHLKLSSKDYVHVELFKKSLKSTNIIKNLNEFYLYKGEMKSSPSTIIRINSTKLVDDLINQGCIQNKTKLMNFPNRIPDKLIRHFIRGYFDGDGSIHFSKLKRFIFYICSSSMNFLKEIEKIFTSIGVTKTNFRKANDGRNLYILTVYRINDLKRIYSYFYNDTSNKFYLNRKKEIFNNIKNYEGKYN